MEDGFYLRKAKAEDVELLFAWANNLDVRRNAFQQQEITWEEHKAWYERKLRQDESQIFIACISTDGGDGKPVGQIRLDRDGDSAQIDYSIDQAFRGKGYGTRMVREAERIADPKIHRLCAKVKRSNPSSARVFEKCGFERRGEAPDYVEYERERIPLSPRDVRPSIVVCTLKSWNVAYARQLQQRYGERYDIRIIDSREQFASADFDKIKPKFIFFPHWSYIIPKSVFDSYTCVVFHMTDLPFGRGGSPLQNLIVRGFTRTKLTAIRVDEGLDTGDIYRKEELGLEGTAEEILRRASGIIFEKMIPYIIENEPTPVPQSGEAFVFQRRKPQDGKLLPEMGVETLYDYIRMLDGEGYPGAFLEFGDYTLRFKEAVYEGENLTARVTFEKK